ncbi:hypothetical protein QYF36_014344 [Acer negundo]|nr:hypothetical protein QYF36_014344 [Acer negundo]
MEVKHGGDVEGRKMDSTGKDGFRMMRRDLYGGMLETTVGISGTVLHKFDHKVLEGNGTKEKETWRSFSRRSGTTTAAVAAVEGKILVFFL